MVFLFHFRFYKGIVPLWGRQIPYTMMKFACFERTVEALYKYVVPKPRADCTKGEQLIVTFVAGYIAGVFCAVVSHPADTIVSKLNQDKNATMMGVARNLGFMGTYCHHEIWEFKLQCLILRSLYDNEWLVYNWLGNLEEQSDNIHHK